MKSFFSFVWDIIKITVITLAIVLPIRYYLVQPFFVKGASMDPTFADGQYLVIDELSYRFNAPQRGDVIIFRYPLDPSQFYIKRVIGLPGETVEISDGAVKIFNSQNPQGFILKESDYLADSYTSGQGRTVISDKEYFVLGDNRQASYDSRRWGAVPKENIIGRAWLRVWPFDSAVIFSAQRYAY